MRRPKRAPPQRKSISSSSEARQLNVQASALTKDIREAIPTRLGRPGREWLKACLDCLRDIA